MQNLKIVREKFQKIFGKVRPPPRSRSVGGGLQVYCMFNQTLPDVLRNANGTLTLKKCTILRTLVRVFFCNETFPDVFTFWSLKETNHQNNYESNPQLVFFPQQIFGMPQNIFCAFTYRCLAHLKA